jgi:hypothetical protein
VRHDTGLGESYMDGDYEVGANCHCGDVCSGVVALGFCPAKKCGRVVSVPPLPADLPRVLLGIAGFRCLGWALSGADAALQVDDLGSLMAVATANAASIEGNRGTLGWLNWLGNKALHAAHLARPNTIAGSRRNIEEHYDAGNAMYKLFLVREARASGGGDDRRAL